MNVDCLHHVDPDILAFKVFVQHSDDERNSAVVDLVKDRATQDQLMEGDVETSLWAETRSTPPEGWSEINDEGSLGKQ